MIDVEVKRVEKFVVGKKEYTNEAEAQAAADALKLKYTSREQSAARRLVEAGISGIGPHTVELVGERIEIGSIGVSCGVVRGTFKQIVHYACMNEGWWGYGPGSFKKIEIIELGDEE